MCLSQPYPSIFLLHNFLNKKIVFIMILSSNKIHIHVITAKSSNYMFNTNFFEFTGAVKMMSDVHLQQNRLLKFFFDLIN